MFGKSLVLGPQTKMKRRSWIIQSLNRYLQKTWRKQSEQSQKIISTNINWSESLNIDVSVNRKEKYASVLSLMRGILAIIRNNDDLNLYQMDVQIAFFNGTLNK